MGNCFSGDKPNATIERKTRFSVWLYGIFFDSFRNMVIADFTFAALVRLRPLFAFAAAIFIFIFSASLLFPYSIDACSDLVRSLTPSCLRVRHVMVQS
jgi:hypothetical protein